MRKCKAKTCRLVLVLVLGLGLGHGFTWSNLGLGVAVRVLRSKEVYYSLFALVTAKVVKNELDDYIFII